MIRKLGENLRRMNALGSDRRQNLGDALWVRAHSGTQSPVPLVSDLRKCLILKIRRDVRVIEGARLESEAGDAHGVTPKHLMTHSIQRFAALNCSSM